MAEPIFAENCIGEIRASTFGREMRKPLADGLEAVQRYYEKEDIFVGQLTDVSVTNIGGDNYRMVLETAETGGS